MQPESDKRVDLAVTVLLGFIFIHTIMASIVPKGEDTSRLSTYTRIVASLTLSICNLAMCALCVFIGSKQESGKSCPSMWLGILRHNLFERCCKVSKKQNNQQETDEEEGIHLRHLEAGSNNVNNGNQILKIQQ